MFKDILERIAGKRFACASRCCGSASPGCAFEMVFDPLLMVRLILGCLIFAGALFFEALPPIWHTALLMLSALIAGLDVIAAAVLGVMNGRPFDKCVLMLLAVVVGFSIGLNEDAAGAMLLFQIGSIFVGYAYDRSKTAVLSAIDCSAERAFVLVGGVESEIAAADVEVGAQLIIHPGEVVPCDCIILEGRTNADTSGLGGSLNSVSLGVGDEILSGSVNMTGRLRCEVTAKQDKSAAANLINTVSRSAEKGGALPVGVEQITDIFAPATLIVAIILSILLIFIVNISVTEAMGRAILFFALANPCALAVAVPLIRLGAMAGAAEKGVVFENCEAMDSAVHVGGVAFEKAGTLTDGAPRVTSVKSERMDPTALLKLAAHAMAYSNMPYAKTIVAAYDGDIQIELVKNFSDISDAGVEAYLGGIRVCAGTRRLMDMKGVKVPESDMGGDPSVYVSVAEAYAGRICLSDSIRQDASAGLREIRGAGVEKIVMFTSEGAASAERSAASVGISTYYSGLSAAQKHENLTSLKSSLGQRSFVYVRGADALAGKHSEADIDVCMCGVDALSQPESTDIMLLSEDIGGVATAVAVARYADRFIKLTVAAVIFAKMLLLILSGFGFITLWFAAFIDTALAIGAILASCMAYGGEYTGRGLLSPSQVAEEETAESYM